MHAGVCRESAAPSTAGGSHSHWGTVDYLRFIRHSETLICIFSQSRGDGLLNSSLKWPCLSSIKKNVIFLASTPGEKFFFYRTSTQRGVLIFDPITEKRIRLTFSCAIAIIL